ncbi:SDR family oxidoreductase [Streptomyces sp. NBC_01525]|uniref:SDR family oxidoreductase n=1 Tax=Streptomyces sp. NBC_01525 TaxID=2903893 RepID=UPI0038649252
MVSKPDITLQGKAAFIGGASRNLGGLIAGTLGAEGALVAVNSKAAFFVMKEAARRIEDGGKIVTIVTSLLAAYTGLYSSYAGSKAPVEHFARALSKELFGRNISVNNIAPGPMDTPFFYPAEDDDSVAFHKASAMNGDLTRIEDIAPWVRMLLTDGWWANGRTLFLNGGYTTR